MPEAITSIQTVLTLIASGILFGLGFHLAGLAVDALAWLV
jgi:small-conductance mechanosensitive channel